MDKPPILPLYEAFFIMSMNLYCESALDSIEEIGSVFEHAYEEKDREVIDQNMDLILNNLQNIIMQGASLSRFFWPSKSGENNIHKKRGQYLRKVFSIKETSPLKNRTLRNSIEHFDEKLDTYFSEMRVGYTVNKYIGAEPDPNGVKNHFFRAYFIDTATFEILGQKLKIEPLMNEIYEIHEKLEFFRQSMNFRSKRSKDARDKEKQSRHRG